MKKNNLAVLFFTIEKYNIVNTFKKSETVLAFENGLKKATPGAGAGLDFRSEITLSNGSKHRIQLIYDPKDKTCYLFDPENQRYRKLALNPDLAKSLFELNL